MLIVYCFFVAAAIGCKTSIESEIHLFTIGSFHFSIGVAEMTALFTIFAFTQLFETGTELQSPFGADFSDLHLDAYETQLADDVRCPPPSSHILASSRRAGEHTFDRWAGERVLPYQSACALSNSGSHAAAPSQVDGALQVGKGYPHHTLKSETEQGAGLFNRIKHEVLLKEFPAAPEVSVRSIVSTWVEQKEKGHQPAGVEEEAVAHDDDDTPPSSIDDDDTPMALRFAHDTSMALRFAHDHGGTPSSFGEHPPATSLSVALAVRHRVQSPPPKGNQWTQQRP